MIPLRLVIVAMVVGFVAGHVSRLVFEETAKLALRIYARRAVREALDGKKLTQAAARRAWRQLKADGLIQQCDQCKGWTMVGNSLGLGPGCTCTTLVGRAVNCPHDRWHFEASGGGYVCSDCGLKHPALPTLGAAPHPGPSLRVVGVQVIADGRLVQQWPPPSMKCKRCGRTVLEHDEPGASSATCTSPDFGFGKTVRPS